jgi:hypothetical protein
MVKLLARQLTDSEIKPKQKATANKKEAPKKPMTKKEKRMAELKGIIGNQLQTGVREVKKEEPIG